MQKKSKIYFALTTAFCGLFWGCYDGETECFPRVSLNFITSERIDSVQFYLNDERVCNGGKGFLSTDEICHSSLSADLFDGLPKDSNKCLSSEEYLSWTNLECFIDEKEYRRSLSSFNLTLGIFSDKGIQKIEMDMTYHTKNRYIIISEQDTTKWYSYSEQSVVYVYDYYGSESTWERIGCYDGYCVAMKPYSEILKENCYDK